MKKIYVAAALGVALAAAFAIPQVRAASTSSYKQLVSWVTTSNPSYSDSTSGALSIGTEGGLRVKGVGAAGTANAGVMTVQGIAAMTPLLVSPNALTQTALPVTEDDHAGAFFRAAGSFTPVGTADRTLISFTGSATKTVRIRRIQVGGVATAAGNFLATVSRTTALGAGGTVVTATAAKVDPNSGAATGVVKHYTTAAQALGTGPTTLWEGRINLAVTGTGTLTQTRIYPEDSQGTQALVLRGASDFLEIGNVAGNITAGAVVDYTIEWSEE